MINTRESFQARNQILYPILILLWSIHFLPFLWPDARLWGINHLLFLEPYFTIIFVVVGIIGLVLLIPSMGRRVVVWFERVAGATMESGCEIRWLLIAVMSIPIFWFLRMPTNLLGDGYTVINNIGNDLPVIFKWSEIGAIWVVHLVSQILPWGGLEQGEYAFAIVSVLSGSVTLLVFLFLANEIGRTPIERLFAVCMFICSGWMLLFFGYAENYPILWPFMTGYILFSIQYIKGKKNLLWPTVMLAIALILHLQTLFFLVSYPVLLFSRGTGKRLYRRYRWLIWSGAGILLTVAMILFIKKYNQQLEFQMHFLPLITGRPLTPNYTIFSFQHLVDIINELSLLIPLWPVLVYFGVQCKIKGSLNKINGFLMAFGLGGLCFLFIIDPRIGMGRDWDMFALTGLGPLILVLRQIYSDGDRIRRFIPALTVMSLILILPFFITNLSYSSSLEYVKWNLRLDQPLSKAGIVMLQNYYLNIGNTKASDSLVQRSNELFPDDNWDESALALAQSGDYVQAMALVESKLKKDPYSPKTFNVRGQIYNLMGHYNNAISDMEQAVRLAPDNHVFLSELAKIYQYAGQYERMMEALRRAQRYDLNYNMMLRGMTMGFYALKQYDSAFVYAGKLVQIEPTYKTAYLVAGASAAKLGLRSQTIKLLNRYLEMNPPDGPEKSTALNLLQQMQ
ncbi:MAG: hypothetical protein GY841_11505 [FCB group bacterium]|nr:hypothetical protein [FCB group bacterium]